MKPSAPVDLNRYDTLLALACFAGMLVLYTRILAPGLLLEVDFNFTPARLGPARMYRVIPNK
jgi:hypothetical protein